MSSFRFMRRDSSGLSWRGPRHGLIASTVTNELVGLDTTTGEKKRVVRDIVDPYQLGFSPDGKWFVTTAYRLDHVDIYKADGFKLVSRVFIDGSAAWIEWTHRTIAVIVGLLVLALVIVAWRRERQTRSLVIASSAALYVTRG